MVAVGADLLALGWSRPLRADDRGGYRRDGQALSQRPIGPLAGPLHQVQVEPEYRVLRSGQTVDGEAKRRTSSTFVKSRTERVA
jgi:hypothetical protein